MTFRDSSGLNAFLYALLHTAAAGGSLQLHHPSPALERLVAVTGSGSLFLALPDAHAAPGRPRSSPLAFGLVPAPSRPAHSPGRCAVTAPPKSVRPGGRSGHQPRAARTTPLHLRRLNRWQTEGLREDLADLYAESCATTPHW
ncbi:STAS domain-containing protein [Streptomyces kaempferi]